MQTKYMILLAALCCSTVLNAQSQVRTFQRNKVLIEKHTGQGCQGCPSADNILTQYLQSNNIEDDVAILRHHSFNPGVYLGTSFSVEISRTWGISAWPTLLVDRYSFSQDKSDLSSRRMEASYLRSLDAVNVRMKAPTYVSLSLEGSSYDPATGRLRIIASGEVTKRDLRFLRIHAFLTQSGVVSYQQTTSGRDGQYVHDDAVRACYTASVDGDQLRLADDGTYHVAIDTVVPSQIGSVPVVAKDMKLVVFVSSYADTAVPSYQRDYTDSEVHNADVVSLMSLPKQSPCAAPSIVYENGGIVCRNTTNGATSTHTIEPYLQPAESAEGSIDLDAPAFVVTAFSTAPGYAPSAKVKRTFTLREVIASAVDNVCDVNGDGKVTKADVEALANKLLHKR